MEEVDHRSCGCPITGSVPSQVGWGFREADLVKDVSGRVRGFRLRDL